jgi:hypothetical protein
MEEVKKRNYWFVGLSEWFRNRYIDDAVSEQVRARNSKGHFVKDDPTTTSINEAYKTVPIRKKRTTKVVSSKRKKPIKRA